MSIDDIYLKKPKTKFTIESGSSDDFTFTCASMQGWRKTMEDAIIKEKLSTGEYLFGILDGHGGFEVSSVVSKYLPRFLESNIKFRNKQYEESLRESFIAIDKWLITSEGLQALVEEKYQMPVDDLIKNIKNQKKQLNKEFFDLSQLAKLASKKIVELIGTSIIDESGSTANIILITKDSVYCANIGDSRSVGIQKGKAIIMSFDHKPTHAKERSRICQAGGFVADGRVCGALSLSRAFGDYQYKDDMVIAIPEIRVFKNIQMIFMACDGIWEGLNDYGENITQKIFKNNREPSDEKLKSLMNQILAPSMTEETIWGLDNMSCILIDFKNQQIKNNKKPLKIKKTIKKQKK
ncbi:unnamed protein product (macronuclear) [Paramecium tetraurelia]|uniref:protein-serine/threonine phosphatase n=1 Tax=Paramecium tetraurelia TaxID=5888 RepID=A0CSU7_PARTE|nr:uncharacterized protein GSPATT00010136001 [Paramecium tetraurelia]CAK73864.1 unnamed protein product [Paramecium tetraurelia]|eukprot:XP_001441261.1 hypothetical protein (macronuclear) [Paramecium tetraurelia strain d4-2]